MRGTGRQGDQPDQRIRQKLGAIIAMAVWVIVGPPASARGEEKDVQLHGFGGWSYGDTDGNRYLTGSEDGEYENVGFSLALTTTPTERIRVSAQIELASDPVGEDEVEVELDYAFAEWAYSDQTQFRLGRSKHPFGIYAEVFDVGTLRPFFDLPQGVYGPTGIAGESYDGLGFTTRRILGDWHLQIDAYVGSLRFETFEPWDGLRDEDDDEPGDDEIEELIETKKRDDVVGFRLVLETPISGLSWGVSAYTGEVVEDEGEQAGDLSRHTGYGLHVDYAADPWTVRAEVAHIDEEDELESDAYYIEVAYMLNDRWQLAARFDHSDTDIEELDASARPTLGQHEDVALGVNYWFSTDLVIKLSVHQVDGNRLALPDEVDESVDTGAFDFETTLVSFGAQFSF